MTTDFDINPFAIDPTDPTPKPEPMTKPAVKSVEPVSTVELVDMTGSAPWCTRVDGVEFALEPGLNRVATSVLTSVGKHQPVVTAVKDGLIKIGLDVVVNLDSISRSTSIEALSEILAVEAAKPVTAGPANRRNAPLCESLKRRIAVLARFATPQSA